ncbi:MAG: Type II secretion system protein D [Chlamydiae bacterium]|nr:Type II secretion system protein D [Chlamydiota bacterium]
MHIRLRTLTIFSFFCILLTNGLGIGEETFFSEEKIMARADEYLASCKEDEKSPPATSDAPTVTKKASTSTDETEETPHLYDSPKEFLLNDAPGRFAKPVCDPMSTEGYTVNFEDIAVIQLIQFISKISKKNYIYDSNDLQFNITIVSEEPASVEDLSATLIQVLRMNNLSVSDQGNNVLIYKDTANLSKLSNVISEDNVDDSCDAVIITRVFRFTNVDPSGIKAIIQPLLSSNAIVEVSPKTRHLIVTDTAANVTKVAGLLTTLDAPEGALEISEYLVKSANPVALAAYAKEILAPLMQDNPIEIQSSPSSKKIFIVANPFLTQKAMQVLESLDTPDITDIADLPSFEMANNLIYMYKLRYQSGDEIAESIRQIANNMRSGGGGNIDFINTLGAIQWVQVNNSIIITGTRDSIDKVVELIEALDKAPKQVYVEVLVLDTTLSNSLDFGVEWIALGDEQDKLAYASGLLTENSSLQGSTHSSPGARFVAANPAANPPGIPNAGRDVPLPTASNTNTAAFGLGIIGNIIRHNGKSFLTLGALISALDSESESKIVLNPRIMVQDTQSADFFVGQNIPYQTTSTVIQQTGSVTQNIQYEDVGVQLRVTPTISPNNIVTLQIDQSIAEVTSSSRDLTPTTNKTLVSTRVHVPDGTFLVMSGHIRDTSTYIHSGIPCLGTLPLIGPAFSKTIERRDKRNLMLFVRPKVITNIQEGLDLTNQEGYDHNWESHPCSITECGPAQAPERETYPPPACPTN